jgi:flagella basal body P-ring formation protein FlgA
VRFIARLRTTTARSPSIRWTLLVMTASTAGFLTVQAIANAESSRDAWRGEQRVVRAARDLEAGHVIGEGDLEHFDVPAAMAPRAALGQVEASKSPVGEVLRRAIGAGEILVEEDVAATHGLAARLPRGTRGVAVPTGLLTLAPGDHVEVVLDTAVAAFGTVIDVNERAQGFTNGSTALIAVAAATASGIAAGVAEGRVTLVLSASPPPRPPG